MNFLKKEKGRTAAFHVRSLTRLSCARCSTTRLKVKFTARARSAVRLALSCTTLRLALAQDALQTVEALSGHSGHRAHQQVCARANSELQELSPDKQRR